MIIKKCVIVQIPLDLTVTHLRDQVTGQLVLLRISDKTRSGRSIKVLLS